MLEQLLHAGREPTDLIVDRNGWSPPEVEPVAQTLEELGPAAARCDHMTEGTEDEQTATKKVVAHDEHVHRDGPQHEAGHDQEPSSD